MIAIDDLERTQLKERPSMQPGDTVKIHVKVREGEKERIQAYEGVVIRSRDRGLRSTFTVRRLAYGTGSERTFPLHSPNIDSIQVIRRGGVRRAKLYYLRNRTGKAARVAEKV